MAEWQLIKLHRRLKVEAAFLRSITLHPALNAMRWSGRYFRGSASLHSLVVSIIGAGVSANAKISEISADVPDCGESRLMFSKSESNAPDDC